MRQPAQTLTSSIAPALITCWRCRGFTSECAREGAARHDLLRRHRRSSSTFPAHRRPLPRAGSSTTIKRSSSSGPTRRRQLWILPDRTRRCSRTVLAALVVHLTPALNATRRAALPPSDVPRHAGSPLALPQRHPPPRRMRRPYTSLQEYTSHSSIREKRRRDTSARPHIAARTRAELGSRLTQPRRSPHALGSAAQQCAGAPQWSDGGGWTRFCEQ